MVTNWIKNEGHPRTVVEMVPPQMINHPRVFFFAVKSLHQETYHSPGGFRHVPAEAGSESLGFHGDLLGFKQEMVIFHGIFHGI